MKLRRLLLAVFTIVIISPIANSFADVQNFYFSDFTADYYLTRQNDGTSNLHVKEVLTAIFPETNQNHGITRNIPYANQGGRNRTVASQADLNLVVLRNGQAEGISKITEEDGYYTLYIGSSKEYVRGKQIYTLEYDFTNVITEFSEDGKNVSGMDGVRKAFQELYWDTNGTGWSQRFDNVTARLHVPPDIYNNMDRQAWCYVGTYGASNQSRCDVTQTDDGFSFSTKNLAPYENLSFVVGFEPDTFEVTVYYNYSLVVLLILEIVVAAGALIWVILKWRRKAKPKYDLYKSLFDTPQYLPPKDGGVNVAEAEQIYIKKTKSSYVATLLELAVSKKVTIKKAPEGEKYGWVVILNVDPSELTTPQKEMVNILYGTSGVKKDTEIPVKKHRATSYLASCASLYQTSATSTMKQNGFLEESSHSGNLVTLVTVIAIMIVSYFVVIPSFPGIINLFMTTMQAPGAGLNVLVGADYLPIIEMIILFATIVICAIINRKTRRFKKYTESGIKMVKYLEGLELYIKMAEADRLKFLQSVKGADTSNEGIVKLYEKLLPWASLFGAEESWAEELSKYYEVEGVDETLSMDVLNGVRYATIYHDISRTITSSTSYSDSSSGGSWSSGSSGGGGGGFSGGGGGGGGGGGW